jgi:isopenicillin N synthase-like dioxygenase
MSSIPVIDLGLGSSTSADTASIARRDVVAEVERACREVGFFVAVGHGIEPQLIEDLRHVGLSFFDLDEETKLAYTPPIGSGSAGYVRSEALSFSRGDASPPDLKESFTIHPVGRPGRPDTNRWPKEVLGFEAVTTRYYAEMERLAGRVMEIFAEALGLPTDFFAPKIDQSLSAVRMLHYPPLEVPPLPGQLRAGAHTDFGSLTLLLIDDAPGGLQVRNTAGDWVDVPFQPGGFVVNLGDLMAQWTNDRWVSTLHRVVVPPIGPDSRRLSVAFFHQPNDDALIEALPTCLVQGEEPRHAPVRSGDHLRRKVALQREMKG